MTMGACPYCGTWTWIPMHYCPISEDTPREQLKRIVDEIAQAAKECIDDPKNVAKGDDWREWEWYKLHEAFDDEVDEFDQETVGFKVYGNGYALPEAGDVLTILAMLLDKHYSEAKEAK